MANKKEGVKPTELRKVSQAFFIALALILTFLLFSRSMAVCWLDPFWHLQSISAAKDLQTPLSFTEHYKGDLFIQAIAFLGLFVLLAFFFGRLFCGWICPFGTLLQGIEKVSPIKHRLEIPPELKDPEMKYIVFVGFILLAFMTGQTAFCEFCPAGTILKGATGHVIVSSIPVFAAVILLVALYGRKTWCSYLCPLGGFFGLFSKVQVFGIKPTGDCVKCLMCDKSCPMDVLVAEKYIQKGKPIKDGDCIKCMNCVEACPRKILRFP